MIAKPTIYKGSVYISASRDREHIRIPTSIKADKLNSNGLLGKSSGLRDLDEKNSHIKDLLKKVQAALDDYPRLSAKELTLYIKRGVLPNISEGNKIKELSFIECFEKFIDDSKTGKRLTAKKTKYENNTIKSYQSVLTNLNKFKDTYQLDWVNINDDFYNQLCEFYWRDSYDNNTGKAIKIIKTMVNYAFDSGLISTPVNVKNWKSWREDIEILVMYADEMKLLYTMPLDNEKLLKTRDIFLMGCFTCFRIENLLSLTENDLQVIQKDYYVNVMVQKTKKHIRIKMNRIGVDIIKKYRNQFDTVLPPISSQNFNSNLKDLAKAFKKYLKELKENDKLKEDMVSNDWEKPFKRIRTKRGEVQYQYIDPADYISSHCMRRTGITNLLMSNLSPFEVQAISGHSLNSRDFTKYVKIASQVVEKKSIDAWTNILAN